MLGHMPQKLNLVKLNKYLHFPKDTPPCDERNHNQKEVFFGLNFVALAGGSSDTASHIVKNFSLKKYISWLLIWNRELREPLLPKRKKEDIWFSPMTKSAYTIRNVKRGKWQHKQRHQKSSITQRLADRLRMVSWSNYGHPISIFHEHRKRDPSSSHWNQLISFTCINIKATFNDKQAVWVAMKKKTRW